MWEEESVLEMRLKACMYCYDTIISLQLLQLTAYKEVSYNIHVAIAKNGTTLGYVVATW